MITDMLFLLVVGHLIADYPLQGDFLSKAKNPTNPIPGVPWYQAMFAHCGIHAGIVFLITGMWFAAFIEFVVHFATDYLKCSGDISYNVDQAIHIMTKVLIVGIVWIVYSMK